MAILRVGATIKVVRLSVDIGRLPTLLAAHRLSDPSTPTVEIVGTQYVADGFPEDRTDDFVRRVCTWGNYEGVWGKVRKHNNVGELRKRMSAAYSAMQARDHYQAILEVTSIRGLAVSFGSKHLKFLDPERAVVLDSIISERLGYRRTPEGYVEFLNDCFALRDLLNNAGIAASTTQPIWRVSDVEMALFKALRE